MEKAKCKSTIASLHFALCIVHCVVLAAAVAIAVAPAASHAAERPLQFIHLLQKNGYADMAVEYLEILAKQPKNMPAEVRDVWDLEMSRSLKAEAAEAFDAKERDRLLEASQQYLAKFTQKKPNSSATATATVAWGESLGKTAIEHIADAKGLPPSEKAQQEKLLAEARAELGRAREKFDQARQIFKKRLDSLPSPSKLPTGKTDRAEAIEARTECESDLRQAEFQSALTQYQLAQTYLDPDGRQRISILKDAQEAFDAIFQRDRVSTPQLTDGGLQAHMLHAKVAEELGDLELAREIYEEVLANPRNSGEKGPLTGWEPWFAQVEYYRLCLVAKQRPKDFLREATTWLQLYRRSNKTDGYQGVALELAKALYAQARKAKGPEKARRTSDALQTLIEMSKVRSQYQHEAILLKREILKGTGKSDLDAATFDEAVALGDAALGAKQWDQARDAFRQALDIAERTKLKDTVRIAAVRENLAGIQLMVARGLFAQGKFGECIEMTGTIIFEDPQRTNVRKASNAAAQASSLAVGAALNLYQDVPNDKKPAALERLVGLAKFTETNWPDLPQADEARIDCGRAKLYVGQIREALDIFERVNPKSERYALAMYSAAQCYVNLYVTEKAKPEETRDAKQMAADRAKAVERLTSALDDLKRQFTPGRQPPRYFFEVQFLLAQLRMEAGELKEAASLYQSLVDIVKAEKPKEFDATTVAIFLGAVRAYCALGDLDKAGDVGSVLIELGPDTRQVNTVLVTFTRLLDAERKRASAATIELENTAKVTEYNQAKARLLAIEKLLGAMLTKLAARRNVPLEGMVFIGDGLNTVGMTSEATQQYQKVLDLDSRGGGAIAGQPAGSSAPDAAKSAGGAVTRVRAQLAGLLRKEGKFEEAIALVDKLIKDNPNALDPLMEKGRILNDWAEQTPARFADAVAHWVMLRTRLQSMRKKPPEYYEVMYNVAACLVREAEKSDDKQLVADRARKSEQVLKSALILSPKLNGPDTVERYKALLKRAIVLQGRSPDKEGRTP